MSDLLITVICGGIDMNIRTESKNMDDVKENFVQRINPANNPEFAKRLREISAMLMKKMPKRIRSWS